LDLEPFKNATYISKMKNMNWDDIRLFIAVAQSGGLTPAAIALGSSAATVGRRMLALEQAVSRKLFVRRQSGYELTPDGIELLKKALAMQSSARPIREWLEAEHIRPTVRISAGTWTANFLCENFAKLWSPDDAFLITFKTTEARLDISHREVDIGIRSHKPDGANLAARKTGSVAHAVYCARNAPSSARDSWVSILPEDAHTEATRWMNAQQNLRIVTWVNTGHTLYDLISAGVGNGVLPCFAGDRDPKLERIGHPLPELSQDQWLVMHDEDRHRAEVRTVIDRLGALLEEHASLFSGARPFGRVGSQLN
jgi:DNA-binding transcriptional LysR family regulator